MHRPDFAASELLHACNFFKNDRQQALRRAEQRTKIPSTSASTSGDGWRRLPPGGPRRGSSGPRRPPMSPSPFCSCFNFPPLDAKSQVGAPSVHSIGGLWGRRPSPLPWGRRPPPGFHQLSAIESNNIPVGWHGIDGDEKSHASPGDTPSKRAGALLSSHNNLCSARSFPTRSSGPCSWNESTDSLCVFSFNGSKTEEAAARTSPPPEGAGNAGLVVAIGTWKVYRPEVAANPIVGLDLRHGGRRCSGFAVAPARDGGAYGQTCPAANAMQSSSICNRSPSRSRKV